MYKTFVAELPRLPFGTGSDAPLLDRLEARVQIGRQADAAAAAPAAPPSKPRSPPRAAPLSPAVAAQVAALQAALDAERATNQALLRSMEGLLVVACEAASFGVVTVLLARGALADNAVDGKGDAALAIACSKGHMNIVRALLDANANVNRRGNHSLTPCVACAHTGTP